MSHRAPPFRIRRVAGVRFLASTAWAQPRPMHEMRR